MAKIIIQVVGGPKRELDGVTTVGEAKERTQAQGYTASLNGNPVEDKDVLRDFDFLSLAPAVKGALPVGTHD